MTFREFINSLTNDQLEDYAHQAGTSVDYLKIQLVPRKRIPRSKLMLKLASEGSPHITRQDVLAHFYPEMFGVAA